MIRTMYSPALLLSALLMTSCAAGGAADRSGWDYVNPNQPDAIQTHRAKADCKMYIDASRQDGSQTAIRHPAFEWEDEFIECMAAKGWIYQKMH